jgi:hypothetical protein
MIRQEGHRSVNQIAALYDELAAGQDSGLTDRD